MAAGNSEEFWVGETVVRLKMQAMVQRGWLKQVLSGNVNKPWRPCYSAGQFGQQVAFKQ